MKNIVKSFLMILISLGILCSCTKHDFDPQKYISYKCYDYHLQALKTTQFATGDIPYATADIPYYNDFLDIEETEKVILSKIPGVSDDQFVHASEISIFNGATAVLQNPNNYIDIWKDWSIKKIEITCVRHITPGKYDDVETVIIASTSDKVCFSELVDFISKEHEYDKNPEGYMLDFSNYHIRVFFNESEHIIWDSKIDIWYSYENQNKIIKTIHIDGGKKPDHLIGENCIYVNIDEYPNLHDWIYNAMSQYINKFINNFWINRK